MFTKTRLKELEARQQLLVVQADLHRHVLGVEAAALRGRFGWLGAVSVPLQAGRKWLLPVAVATGLFTAWQWRRLGRWLPVAFGAWRLIRRYTQR